MATAVVTDTQEFPAMIGRLLAAWAVRVSDGDTYDLREMADVVGLGAEVVGQAVGLNRMTQPSPWSWSEVGDALGMTRQAAQQRWGHVVVTDAVLSRWDAAERQRMVDTPEDAS